MNRTDLLAHIKDYVQNHPHILAAWEAGSAATNTLDDYSDLDVLCITKEQYVESTLQDILAHIHKELQVDREFRMPEPAWHGFSQVFMSFQDAEHYVYLDLSITKDTNPDLFTDQERHGVANVWFDKPGIYQEKHTTDEQIEGIRKRILGSLNLDFVIILELQKAMARHHTIDIQTNLMTFLQRFYGPLMNLTYRPAKADFGLRYIERDWPKQAVQKLHMVFDSTGEIKNQRIHELIEEYQTIKRELE